MSIKIPKFIGWLTQAVWAQWISDKAVKFVPTMHPLWTIAEPPAVGPIEPLYVFATLLRFEFIHVLATQIVQRLMHFKRTVNSSPVFVYLLRTVL